jgi:sugar/nucleoside kinase (ribokinase family)
MRKGLISGGNWIVDHVKLIDTWPAQDALASIKSQSQGTGGSPYNILVDLAILGAPFPLSAAGLVGEDNDGRSILSDCRNRGIDTKQLLTTTEASTSYTDVMTVESTGRRTFFHQRGANARLDVGHFDFTNTTAKLFHFGYLLLLDRLDTLENGVPRCCEVLKRARAAGLRTSVDCVSEDSQRFKAIVGPTLPLVDVLFINDFEAERLTGLSLGRGANIKRSAVVEAGRKLIADGVKQWVVIHFPEGSYAHDAKGNGIWQASLKLPKDWIAGAAGAGDAFAAGCLYGIHEEWPMAESLKLGVCCAAASLSHPSCTAGVRSLKESLALADKFGFQTLPA